MADHLQQCRKYANARRRRVKGEMVNGEAQWGELNNVNKIATWEYLIYKFVHSSCPLLLLPGHINISDETFMTNISSHLLNHHSIQFSDYTSKNPLVHKCHSTQHKSQVEEMPACGLLPTPTHFPLILRLLFIHCWAFLWWLLLCLASSLRGRWME